jgi:predicted dehydrogenase
MNTSRYGINLLRRGDEMAEVLRAGVIGCGMIAKRVHVPDYYACSEADIVALCDTDEQKARELADEFAPSAKVYTDHKQMLEQEKLDCVTIALPNFLHASVSIDCLNAGCHVLVEKPMAASSEEAQQMIDASKKAGKLMMVDQSQRCFPVHRKAREVIQSGMMGKILHVTAMFGHAGPEFWSPSGKWFFDKKKARFGAMADLGVHKADLLRFLTGKEVSEISAYYERLEKEESSVEDNFVSCLKFEDGTVGTLCASWTVKGTEANYTILHCEKGTLTVSGMHGHALVANLVDPVCDINFPVPPAVKNEGGSAWGIDVSGSFARACLGIEEPFCTGEEGKRSLDVILAAEKAALEGKSIKVEH